MQKKIVKLMKLWRSSNGKKKSITQKFKDKEDEMMKKFKEEEDAIMKKFEEL